MWKSNSNYSLLLFLGNLTIPVVILCNIIVLGHTILASMVTAVLSKEKVICNQLLPSNQHYIPVILLSRYSNQQLIIDWFLGRTLFCTPVFELLLSQFEAPFYNIYGKVHFIKSRHMRTRSIYLCMMNYTIAADKISSL